MAEQAKHTAGPWERLEGFAEPGHPIYKPGTRVIRIVQKRAPGQADFVKVALVDSAETWDDARLIAAAPDLLAALKGLVPDIFQAGPLDDLAPQMRAGVEAIVKAEGWS